MHPLAGDQRREQAGEADAGTEVGDQLIVAEVAAGQHDAAGEAGEAARHEHRPDAVAALGDAGAMRGLGVAAEHPQPEPDHRAVEHQPDDDCESQCHAAR